MKNQKFSKSYYLVNEILKEWNPIGVDEVSLSDEYIRYIPAILKIKNDLQNLISHLEDMLIMDMGLDYISSNEQHKSDLINIARKIYELDNR